MFEQPAKSQRGLLWKVLPVAALVFVAIIAVFVYFGTRRNQEVVVPTGVLHEGDPDYGWYSKYVRLDPNAQKIQLGQNFLGDRVVMFSGIIENGGDKVLDVVEVKLALFNDDKLVWETTRRPVFPGDRRGPIPALGKRPFALYLETLPDAWTASHAEMSVQGFRFLKREGGPS